MAKAFTTWTVLPHKPIQKLTENLWTVEGTLPRGQTRRIMTLARLHGGELLIHNGIALDEHEMAEVEAFGTPAYLVVPNGFHRQDARIFKDRYPRAKVLCPKGATSRVTQVVPVDGSYASLPADDDVKLIPLDGAREEGVVQVRSADGTTLVFNDAVMNMPPLPGVMGFALGPTGKASVPRVIRWIGLKDKAAFRAHLLRLAALPDLKRIIVSHGKMMTESPGSVLQTVAAGV